MTEDEYYTLELNQILYYEGDQELYRIEGFRDDGIIHLAHLQTPTYKRTSMYNTAHIVTTEMLERQIIFLNQKKQKIANEITDLEKVIEELKND